MSFSFLTQELAIDLGTANTLIIQDDKIVLDEPSIIAKDIKTGDIIAVGSEAQQMEEHANPGIITVRPLVNGVIADYDAAKEMLSGFIKIATNRKKSIFAPSLKLVIGIPGGSTKVDMRSIRDSAKHAKAHEIYLIYEPMATALGIGLEVHKPKGNMVVDIGDGTTEIAVITLGGIAESSSIHDAGNEITTDIIDHMCQMHNICIGRTTAENIKLSVGSVLVKLPEGQESGPFIVRGRSIATGHTTQYFMKRTIVHVQNLKISQLFLICLTPTMQCPEAG